VRSVEELVRNYICVSSNASFYVMGLSENTNDDYTV
jgi:hypothetical protein